MTRTGFNSGQISREGTVPRDLALSYPYAPPNHAFTFQAGVVTKLNPDGFTPPDHTRPIIACGSNRAPSQLVRKFQDDPAISFTVIPAWLSDADVVYAGHITSYGAVPATLTRAPGCRVRVSVMWLDEIALARLDETESLGRSYDRLGLTGLVLEQDGGNRLDQADAYVARSGVFQIDGVPIGIEEIDAQNRPHTALAQRSIQSRLHKAVTPDLNFMMFMDRQATDVDHRGRVKDWMAQHVLPHGLSVRAG